MRLGDVAQVELRLGRAPRRTSAATASRTSASASSRPRPRTASTSRAPRAPRPSAIQTTLPEGTQIFVAFDTTIFIDASVERVYTTLLEAIALVLLVIYLFLGSVRAALIPAVTVPVCLVAAFIALYAFGFSINLLTLLALVLCIGLVVDDAIVVLENIQRRVDLRRAAAGGGEARHARRSRSR